MSAPEGNDYYKLRSKDGRDRIFKRPEDLLNACNDYFEWISNNPMKEQNLFAFQGEVTKADANKMRPMSVEGLCNFIDIAKSTFYEYAKLEGFSNITTRVTQIIETQQFEGAASGFLNANIIARKLGLSEKTENRNDNLNVNSQELTEEQINKLLDKL